MEKFRVLAFQKVAKTGNIGKKNPVAGDIHYVRYLSMQKVNLLRNVCVNIKDYLTNVHFKASFGKILALSNCYKSLKT